MFNDITEVSVYLLPGMSVTISAPLTSYNFGGWFARLDPLPEKYFGEGAKASLTLTRGFTVMDPEVGTIVEEGAGASVTYTHKKAMTNAIWFFARTGERAVVNVISVPIHDHSNIVQGGPAFGTYFNDDSTGG